MRYYTSTHEWCDLSTYQMGLSEFAKLELGEIVYLKLPQVGTEVKAGDELCILESTKAAADVYAPYDGCVIEVNSEAIDHINQDPQGKGWLVKIAPKGDVKTGDLMTHVQYIQMLES